MMKLKNLFRDVFKESSSHHANWPSLAMKPNISGQIHEHEVTGVAYLNIKPEN